MRAEYEKKIKALRDENDELESLIVLVDSYVGKDMGQHGSRLQIRWSRAVEKARRRRGWKER